MPIDRNSSEYLQLHLTYARNEATKFLKYRAEKDQNFGMEASPEVLARVRRALFGPADPEGNTRFLEEQVRQLDLIEKERWGYDFKAEAPLPGYKWERKTTHKPKPRKVGQPKLTEYLPSKKTAEDQKKLKLILDNIKDEDLDEMQVSS